MSIYSYIAIEVYHNVTIYQYRLFKCTPNGTMLNTQYVFNRRYGQESDIHFIDRVKEHIAKLDP